MIQYACGREKPPKRERVVMKLDETNAKFAVVKTTFHNGGTISFHKSFDAAVKSMEKWIGNSPCTCGCAAVVPVASDAETLREYRLRTGNYEYTLYADLPEWDSVSGLRYDRLCR